MQILLGMKVNFRSSDFTLLFPSFFSCRQFRRRPGQTAQQNVHDGGGSNESRRLSHASELANDNYMHLAAAPRQIQEVLLKDTVCLSS